MTQTIDMQTMRHLNLFEKITRIRTRFCFKYNEMIFFCVPRQLISQAIGRDGENVKKIYNILGKKIKIIPEPRGIEDIRGFIEAITSPVQFNEIEVSDKEVILNSGRQSKAALIGRNKRRLNEMQLIVKNFFAKDFRII